ncbi:MAG: hypothetical protein DCO97_04215 [Marivita sp. XM-24bin2]|nr:MAG: hypothetical protein DCO97_04215 [Marivita sp. XM-24bin2]
MGGVVSEFLDSMRRDFDARMSAHEGMLAHLGLYLTEHDSPFLISELKETFRACGACRCPKSCLDWQSGSEEGPPPWCHKRHTFLSLIDACNALADARISTTGSV